MSKMNVLITGGLGCIGSEAAKWTLRNTDARVVIGSRKASQARMQRVLHDVDTARLEVVETDLTHANAMAELLQEKNITHVVHMAALQTPDCNTHRDLGLQTNLAGTQNLIEAMKASGCPLERFVFASSIAVYGPRALYPAGQVPMLAQPQPVNVYGAWKLAGEHISRFFCQDSGVPTVCLRPGVLFGPGRNAGLTSTPTTAMKHVVVGRSYEIPYQSRQDYLYAPDVGAAVGRTLVDAFDGYGVFTLPSHTLTTQQFVDTLRIAATDLGLESSFDISIGTDEVPFICDLEYKPFLDAFPQTPHTPVADALQQSLRVFQDQAQRGWLEI